MATDNIDFVITWVDGNDPKWLAEREKFLAGNVGDHRSCRYRNWDNLQYFFRGVEAFAPWVNRIFFITWGHIPEWLNTQHPKLKIVRHEEFIAEDCLPTFNSNAIELMINRIEGLSNKFVLFNDDIFLIKPTKSTDFFMQGLPCDSAYLTIHSIALDKTDVYASLQAIGIINKYFNMKKSILGNFTKWFNPIYGKQLLKTIYLLPCPVFPEIRQNHLPCSYLKETFDTLWDKEGELLNETCHNKFRTKVDYSHWTMRNWQIAAGDFYPRKTSFGKSFVLNDDKSFHECLKYIENSKGSVICINDEEKTESSFIKHRDAINKRLNTLLPNKSSFEK